MTLPVEQDESTPNRIAELTQTVAEQQTTIEALILAAERRTAGDPDSAALATWQRNLTLQRRIVERTNRVRVAEQVLRNVIDSLERGMCILAADGTIIDTNRIWQEMLGATAGNGCFYDLPGQLPADVGALLSGAAEAVRAVLAGHEALTLPGHRVMVDGDERWWKARVDRVRGHDEAQAVVTLEDVTGQTLTQEKLRQATRDASRLALVARHMDDAVVIADAAGVIEWVNPAFVQMSGYSMAEAIGRTRLDLLNTPHPLPLPETYASAGEQIMLPEFLAQTKDGRPYWLKVELYRVLDDDGVMRVVGVERDVTALRTAEETLLAAIEHSEALAQELSTEKALLAEVISSIPHLIYWKDYAGRYQGYNTAFMAMRSMAADADLIGHTDRELNAQDDFSRVLADLEEQVFQTGRAVVDHHVTVTGLDGARSLLMSVLPQPDAVGDVGGLIVVGADVTRISELERQLSQTNRLESIGQLAAGIAHEINTPIQFVSDNTRFVAQSFDQLLALVRRVGELCAGPPADDPAAAANIVAQLAEAVDEVDIDFLVAEIPGALTESLEGLERVAQIVRAMKDFSHPGQGRRDTDINRAIESTAQVARNEWKYHAELDLRLGADVGLVPCYEGEFKQVMLNLIVNAAHAIEAKGPRADGAALGRIQITTVRLADRAEISVADDGTGMDEATRQRIFDPFFTTKGVGKGTGQGLSMAYASIVHKHSGAIRVESAPGQGTTFVVVLPLVVDPAPAVP